MNNNINNLTNPSHLCFVDEAGDEGVGRGSRYFIVGAVVVKGDDLAGVEADFGRVKDECCITPGKALHFRNLSHPNKKYVSARVGAQTLITGVVVVSDTNNIPAPAGPIPARPKNWIYHLMTRYLLERVGRIVQGQGGSGVEVIMSNRSSLSYSDLEAYLKKIAVDPAVGKEIALLTRLRALQHGQALGLEIADVFVSSIFPAFELDLHGNHEETYIASLAPRLYRPNGVLIGNGIKFMGKKVTVDAFIDNEAEWLKKL